ncbi:MAG: hypothetical protein JJU13_14250 [Balneolaceae bacterium]|nr:hypothetical protein [Balneolaceae bacterium]
MKNNNLVIRNFFTATLLTFVFGCSHSSIITEREDVQGPESDYSVIIVIHGDSDYLYHTAEGMPVQANEKALEMALDIARKGKKGEFFIIHQQPKKRFMYMISRRSSELYHFKNGEIFQHVKYRNEADDEPFLSTEAHLYRELSGSPQIENRQLYFLYFGHEIPVEGKSRYFSSRPKMTVNTESFASGLQKFLNNNESFGLVTLSTCSNGTPQMARHLSPFTHYLLASPQNLHLSYFNIGKLNRLESNPKISPDEVAAAMAKQSYQRLSDTIQTVVSLSIYDLEKTADYLEGFYLKYERHLSENQPNLYRENIDCGGLPFFDKEKYTVGVTTFFRAPRFGSQASGEDHSGWGCKGK